MAQGTVELGVRVDNNQPAGTYTGTFIFTVTANDLKYSITYDDNGADDNKPANKNGSAPEGTQVPLAGAPTRNGYVFLGWCDKETRGETCTDGNEYEAGGNYKLTNSANNVTLYAMWAAVPTTMQSFDSYCQWMTTYQTLTLTDSRDNNTYRMRKLADDKCWMIDNLKIADKTLTSADSNVSSDFALPASSTDGFSSDNTASNVYVNSTYGGYYTWCAATAGTCSIATSSGAKASGSICPKGWRLPTGGASGEFKTLNDKENSGSTSSDSGLVSESGPALKRGGNYYLGSLWGQDSSGFYWSSTAYSSAYAHYLHFGSSYVYPATNLNRSTGIPVRCVAE